MKRTTSIALPLLHRRQFLRAASAAGLALTWPGRLLPAEVAAADGKELIVHSAEPLNAEPQLPALYAAGWKTPLERFYVRSHAPAPRLDERSFTLSVEGMVDRPLALTLADLRKMKSMTQAATLTCAGNRRREHSETKPVEGVQWDAGAIGNADWEGPALADVLEAAGVQRGAKHVWLDGADRIEREGGPIPFGASIPLVKARRPAGKEGGPLLAHKMNGEPLAVDHGFPLRAVVPGYIGARSVKWLARITVSDRPSDNHYVADAYKIVSEATADAFAAAEPIYEFPINAAICTPTAGSAFDLKNSGDAVEITGYAIPPGDPGRRIGRVEVSIDGGRTWAAARLDSNESPFCWRLWRARVRATPDVHELIVRAIDDQGNAQPKKVEWNAKGYLFNAWHRVEPGGEK